LSLVSNAWAGFGAAFGPLVLFSLYNKNLTHKAAIAGIVSGAATVLFWIYAPVLADGKALTTIIYEMIPGFLVSSAAIWITSRLDTAPCNNTVDTFNKVGRELTLQR
jgi:SSS family solute:Na+ symporter